MSDLADFLVARIGEDEALANAHLASTWRAAGSPVVYSGSRLLAECDAKRRIVARYLGAQDAMDKMTDPIKRLIGEAMVLAHHDALQALGLVYTDHPDYDEGWRS